MNMGYPATAALAKVRRPQHCRQSGRASTLTYITVEVDGRSIADDRHFSLNLNVTIEIEAPF